VRVVALAQALKPKSRNLTVHRIPWTVLAPTAKAVQVAFGPIISVPIARTVLCGKQKEQGS